MIQEQHLPSCMLSSPRYFPGALALAVAAASAPAFVATLSIRA